jgi:hypothetical protein
MSLGHLHILSNYYDHSMQISINYYYVLSSEGIASSY